MLHDRIALLYIEQLVRGILEPTSTATSTMESRITNSRYIEMKGLCLKKMTNTE